MKRLCEWPAVKILGRKMTPVCLIVLCLAGCASRGPEAMPPSYTDAPPIPVTAPGARPEPSAEGSLWSDEGMLAELFVDPKARRVGDIVTIEIVEATSASNSASTETDRESSLSAGVEKFFGIEKRFTDPNHPDYKPYPDVNPFAAAGEASVKGSMSSEFEGNGSTTRKGAVKGIMTARVVEVTPGGNLRIVGSREVTVNHERQFITLYGVIRPRDISANNIILSSYIADARIAYSGSGVIDDRQRPGWMANILNNIWPF
ncbi:MAG: flagellar basal body L-ring protein FlgH [Desulfobacterales bacterium]